MPLTAPMNDVAPIWSATPPIWTEMITPNGIATRIVGSSETRVMNQAWSRNSVQENRRATMSVTANRTDSQPRTTSSPLVTTPCRARPARLPTPDRVVAAMVLTCDHLAFGTRSRNGCAASAPGRHRSSTARVAAWLRRRCRRRS